MLNHSCMKLVMVPEQKYLTRVGSGQFFVAWVGTAIFVLSLGLENFPKFFNFFPSGQK